MQLEVAVRPLGIRFRDARLDRFDLRARLFQSYARLQLSGHVDHRRRPAANFGFRANIERRIRFDLLRVVRIAERWRHGQQKPEARSEHSDDRHGPALQGDRAPDHPWIASKTPFKKPGGEQ